MDALSLYLVTWNVACKPPEENLNDLLGFTENSLPLPDIYVIALQEVKSQPQNIVIDALFSDPWTTAIKTKLRVKNYVQMKTIRLQGIILSLFVLRPHVLHIRNVQTQYVKTGLAGLWGNKGAVSIRANLYGVSVCFVNSHFTPHDQNLSGRILDYTNVIREMSFPKQPETTRILYHDYVFWLGDHNFRIDESVTHDEIIDKILNNDLEWLQTRDQLRAVMKTGEAFSELFEPSVDFPPTFKFHFHTSDYDNKRRPAWTDRILYKVTNNAYSDDNKDLLSVNLQNYTSLKDYTQSDHKPVIARYTFKIRSSIRHIRSIRDYGNGYEENVLPEGKVIYATPHVSIVDNVDVVIDDNSVMFEPIYAWFLDRNNTVSVKPGREVKVSDFDWVAIFKEDFSSLDEYLCFLYINPRAAVNGDDIARSTNSSSSFINTPIRSFDNSLIRLTFPDKMLTTPGNYILLYITHDSESVLGMSSVFHAEYSDSLGSRSFGIN